MIIFSLFRRAVTRFFRRHRRHGSLRRSRHSLLLIADTLTIALTAQRGAEGALISLVGHLRLLLLISPHYRLIRHCQSSSDVHAIQRRRLKISH